MQPIFFEGAQEVCKPANMTDEQCFSVWAQPVDYVFTGKDGHTYKTRMWVEAWRPSKEDLEALNRGEPIFIHIHSGRQLIPISIFTLDENGNSNDAG